MPGQYSSTDIEQPKAAGQFSGSDIESDKGGWLDHTIQAVKNFGSGVGEQINPVSMLAGARDAAAAAVYHPLDTAKAILQKQGEPLEKAKDSFSQGDYVSGVRHAIGYMLPIIGPGIDAMGDDAASGHVAHALGSATGFGLTMAAPELAAKAAVPISKASDLIAKVASKATTETLGTTTGAGGNAMRQALQNPTPDLMNAMRGNTTDTEVLGHFKDALQGVKDRRGADYQQALAQLPASTQLDITPVHDALQKQFAKFGIKTDPQGALDFSRSVIRDKSAQSDLSGIADDLRGWGSQPGDLSPSGVDILKRRIDDTYSPSGSARAIVQNVKDAARSALNDQVPGYSDMTKGYAKASEFIDHVKDLSLDSKNPGTAIRKLTTTLKANNDYREALTDALGQYTNVDLKGELAGMNLSRLAPRGLAGPSTGFGILAGIASHVVSPMAAVAIAMSSPRLMGELMAAMAKVKPFVSVPASQAAKAIPAMNITASQLKTPFALPKAAQNDSQNPVIAGIQP